MTEERAKSPISTSDLSCALRNNRQRPDAERIFKALALLHVSGVLAVPFIRMATSPDIGVPPMFALLVALGRGDLSVARLYEGHVNALQLIARLGTCSQLERTAVAAANGGLIGVWGADDPASPARMRHVGKSCYLSGRKTYASGADVVTHAVIAVKTADDGTQLILLDRGDFSRRLDRDWWRPLGMQATNSFALDLVGIETSDTNLIGVGGVYESQPFFGAGAIRFVAAQLGGTLALWDATREHLTAARRHDNPHQAARLGHIISDLEAAHALARDAYTKAAPAIAWENVTANCSDYLYADCARVVVEAVAERVMALALRSVGCAGLMDTHPLAATVRDLMVYLRQPAPDAALTRLGINACAGGYQALFDEQ